MLDDLKTYVVRGSNLILVTRSRNMTVADFLAHWGKEGGRERGQVVRVEIG